MTVVIGVTATCETVVIAVTATCETVVIAVTATCETSIAVTATHNTITRGIGRMEITVETPIDAGVGGEIPLQVPAHLVQNARIVRRVRRQQGQRQQQQRV